MSRLDRRLELARDVVDRLHGAQMALSGSRAPWAARLRHAIGAISLRIADWATRDHQPILHTFSEQALAEFLERAPAGAMRSQAAALLEAERARPKPVPRARPRPLLTLASSNPPVPTLELAAREMGFPHRSNRRSRP